MHNRIHDLVIDLAVHECTCPGMGCIVFLCNIRSVDLRTKDVHTG